MRRRRARRRGSPAASAVIVPFTGAEHDWSAVELGAWFALGTELPLRLPAPRSAPSGGDASRLLASASLAVQRAFGVHAEPMLVEPTPEALVAATQDAALVVVGLTDRWRRDGHRARSRRARRVTSPSDPSRPQRLATRWSRSPLEPDPLHLDDRAGRLALAQGGGVAFRHGWLPGPGGGDLERSPPKLCSTPGHDADELDQPVGPRRRPRSA